MPSFDILKETKKNESFRAASVRGMFDLPDEPITEKFHGVLPIENLESWNIGVIYGPSGSGKSTISKYLFGDFIQNFEYKSSSVIDDMPQNKSVKDICSVFNIVGFSSPKSWLKPFSVLSEGEKMRVNLARAILSENELTIFDEYTSVVNREVAKIGSFALQKAVRNAKKRFIAVSCHDDIIDWLQPDWVFFTGDMSFSICKKKDQKFIWKSEVQMSGGGSCIASITI